MYQNISSGYIKYYIEYAQIDNSGNTHTKLTVDMYNIKQNMHQILIIVSFNIK